MENGQISAYPYVTDSEYATGLSKLEAFTMAAMQGISANNYNDMSIGEIADQAIILAEATLRRLSKQQQP